MRRHPRLHPRHVAGRAPRHVPAFDPAADPPERPMPPLPERPELEPSDPTARLIEAGTRLALAWTTGWAA